MKDLSLSALLNFLKEQVPGVVDIARVKTVARCNELCAKGGDTDFGVPARFLPPVEEVPFYARKMPAQTLVV